MKSVILILFTLQNLSRIQSVDLENSIRIGILSLQFKASERKLLNNFFEQTGVDPLELSKISGAYAEFVKNSGAIPVAIPITENDEIIFEYMNQLDGVFLTGGSPKFLHKENDIRPLSTVHILPNPNELYFSKIRKVIDMAIQINKTRYFPLFAICLGFESLLLHFSNFDLPFRMINKNNVSDSITIVPSHSKFFDFVSSQSPIDHLEAEVQFNNGHGVTLKDFLEDKRLHSEFIVPVTYFTPFIEDTLVGAIEHRKLPIFGVQFHPEKVLYSQDLLWNPSYLPQSTQRAQLFQNYFNQMMKGIQRQRKQGFTVKLAASECVMIDFPGLERTWVIGKPDIIKKFAEWTNHNFI